MAWRGAKVLMRCNTAAWAIMAHMVHTPNTPKAPWAGALAPMKMPGPTYPHPDIKYNPSTSWSTQ
jgi:hypothetical protein